MMLTRCFTFHMLNKIKFMGTISTAEDLPIYSENSKLINTSADSFSLFNILLQTMVSTNEKSCRFLRAK